MSEEYNGDSIEILEGLEAVRKRPGMYIGSTNTKGLHHMIKEITDNSVDEAVAGYCDEIITRIHKDNSISIEDNGRGVPVDVHRKAGYSTARVIYTILHAGGKFGGNGYKVSGGLHGVGASVVNALSSYLEVEIHRNGKIYKDRYENGGVPVIPLTENGELPSIGDTDRRGTKVRFLPDNTILETTEWNIETIEKRLQESAFLNKGLKFVFIDERTGYEKTFCEKDGIGGLVKEINHSKPTLTDVISFSGVSKDIEVQIAFQYVQEYNEHLISYCNNIITPHGGTHIVGLKSGITRLINGYAKELGLLKTKDNTIDGAHIRTGIVAVVSIRHSNPQYEGQTKEKLGSTDAKGAVEEVIKNEGSKFFDLHVEEVKRIIENAMRVSKIRETEEKSRDNSLQKKDAQLQTNGKLASASSKTPVKKKEIYLVEGDSAGGTAKQARDRKTQAILPAKGKIINVEKARIDKVLSNEEIQSIIVAIGGGHGKAFDISKVNYGRVVIMTDADVDGAHIRTLLLTFFYRYMRPLIEEGYVWIAVPPLYQIVHEEQKGRKKVETSMYAYSDEELVSVKNLLGNKIKRIQRYKGLGEMSATQLWDTTLNPETRKQIQVRIEDAKEADAVTELLMGDKVAPRREFIISEAHKANIDI
ncbi:MULTISPECIES: DNA gyrase/topoisomerase IV subunit B [Bacillus]|uniref:DNA topoisomerase (ATP-hydrolyzing) n=2 Tax=Bacillus thuringiensis TaxID=1428 RepID=A0AAP4Q6J4_BACTU|nr:MULTISPECIES: DNA gyrase subunit B [Bacillus]MEC0045703.1 DNA gyrase subunit B [Bacillus cereus]AFV21340.1 DNA gyrase subunit B [Bacillus thuringiensis Bt407]EEM24907.1 DNA topoisomerase [Bacillus thuringiensis Bt407]ERI00747.1 DNA topoisomerase 4 subunit B [Bacillus thuringiensis T01-328]MBN6707531.1 DNA gyrase subunit B [Bacillus thuringiensis]